MSITGGNCIPEDMNSWGNEQGIARVGEIMP